MKNPEVKKKISFKTQQGFVTLFSVVILGSVALVFVIVISGQAVWEAKTSQLNRDSTQARKLAGACLETALLNIHDNNSFTGSGNQSLGGGSCSYLVTNTGGNTRQITATGTLGSVMRKASVSVSGLSPAVTVSSWQELP